MSNNIPNISRDPSITIEFDSTDIKYVSPSVTGFVDGSFAIASYSLYYPRKLTVKEFDTDGQEIRPSEGGIRFGMSNQDFLTSDNFYNPQVTRLNGFNNGRYVLVSELNISDRRASHRTGLYLSDSDIPTSSSGDRIGDYATSSNYTPIKLGSQHTNAVVTPTSEGGFLISWETPDGFGSGIKAIRYDQNFDPVWESVGSVNNYTTSDQENPDIVALSTPIDSNQDGINDAAGFVIAWQSKGQDGNDWGIFARRYDEKNNPVSSEFRVNTTTIYAQQNPTLTSLINGGFMVAWESDEQDGSGWGIFAQRYDFLGNRVGDEFQVNTYTNLDQTNVAAETLSDGSVVLTWQSQGQDGSGNGIFAQMFDMFGNRVGDEFQVNGDAAFNQTVPSIAKRGNDGFVIAWQSEDNFTRPKVQAQMFQWPGYTPPAFSIDDVQIPENGGPAVLTVSLSEPVPQTISVKWRTQDGTGVSPFDYRPEYEKLDLDFGVLTFNPGDTTKTITIVSDAIPGTPRDIEIRDDDIDEPNEYFDVVLFDATTNNILDPLGRVTIQPTIELPHIIIDDPIFDEDAGFATVIVRLTEPSSNTVTVEYMTEDNTAVEPFDYESISGIIEFQIGETQKSIQIPINDDGEFEQDETFFLKLKNPSFAEISDDTGILTIKYDPDDKPNEPPIFIPAPIIPCIKQDDLEQIGIYLQDYFRDEETDSLTYQLVNPGEINKSLTPRTSGGYLFIDFLLNQVIELTEFITIRATDTEGLYVDGTFKITLEPGDDDAYEANDQFINAYDLTNVEGTWLSDILGKGIAKNDDYYKITVPENSQKLIVDLEFTHEQADLDLVLYDAQTRFVKSSISSTDNESITLDAPKPGDYYVWVRSFDLEASNSYNLKYENLTEIIPPPPENTTPYLDPEIPDMEQDNLEQIRIFLPDHFKDKETDNLEYELVNPGEIDKKIVNARINDDNYLSVDFFMNEVTDFMESITVRGTDEEGLFVDDTFTINLESTPENTPPEKLQFNVSIEGNTVKLTNAWIYDEDGYQDLTHVDLWVRKEGEDWEDIADITNFKPWQPNNNWASIDHEINFSDYESGSYEIWARGYDKEGLESNAVSKDFDFLTSGNDNIVPSDTGIYFAIDAQVYTSNDTLNINNGWVRDLNGVDDIQRIDFWLLKQGEGEDWQNIEDISSHEITPWTQDTTWGSFNYSLGLTELTPGNYTLWSGVQDQALADNGTWANIVQNNFEIQA
ncbi:MAG: Calx-beta domain-containing protein [Crocosphaera sp.]